jgi:predicted ATP-dependent endonuclease of OLD family
MIERINLKNYRCFKDTTISFKNLSIIVGKNNAGKSTLIEALRIVSIATNRAKHINYNKPPDWLDIKEDIYGISPSIDNLDISSKNIFHMYGEGPAIITAFFDNKSKIEVYVGEDAKIFAILSDSQNRNVASKGFAANLALNSINILPQISPILREEKILKFRTVQKNVDTNLSSRNFRNQLKYFQAHFPKFRELSESTWNGLAVDNLDEGHGGEGETLNLMIRDNNFVSEIGWMGHGLQMWLQTMWFISGCEQNSTVILDEPDVYMHADLQRKLIRFIKNRFRQVMIATHSIEIMSEVDAESVLPIDSSKEKITYANKTPIVQEIIDKIGSIHNIEIARLFVSKKFLIVEGNTDDIKLLSIFQATLFKDSSDSFEVLPKTYIEGWGGWQRVIGSVKVFKDNQTNIKTYCILDSDYHLDDQIKERYSEAKSNKLNLHIWKRKEIENYLLVPPTICRIIERENRTENPISLQIFNEALTTIIEELKLDIIDNFATEISSKDKSKAPKTFMKEARELFQAKFDNDFLAPIPGKTVISKLSEWTNKNYKVNLNPFKIAREIGKFEIPKEIVDVITVIENKSDFNYTR